MPSKLLVTHCQTPIDCSGSAALHSAVISISEVWVKVAVVLSTIYFVKVSPILALPNFKPKLIEALIALVMVWDCVPALVLVVPHEIF